MIDIHLLDYAERGGLDGHDEEEMESSDAPNTFITLKLTSLKLTALKLNALSYCNGTVNDDDSPIVDNAFACIDSEA